MPPLTATTKLTNRLTYVFDWTYNQQRYKVDGEIDPTDTWYAYGINNEIIFQANKKWAFGTRFGMLRPDGDDRKTEWYNVSLGANWTPNKWLVVKPEVRYDWTDKGDIDARKFFNNGNNTYQLSGGMSAVVKF